LVSLVLVIGLTLGACAQNPASQQEKSTVTPRPASTAAPEKTPKPQPTITLVTNVIPPFDLTPILTGLSGQIKVPVEQIRLVDWQPVTWRDSCLGVQVPKQGCADMITPGFILTFQVEQKNYTVHSDAVGKNFRLAPDSGAQDSPGPLPAVSWTRSGGIAGICQNLTAYSTGNYWLRDCNKFQILAQGILPEGHQTYLSGLWEKYASFEWNTVNPPGSADMFNDQVRFYAGGAETMTADKQQNMDQYLAQLVNELSSSTNATGASSGIIGQVMVGPTCGGPVGANSSTECADKPYPTTVTILDQSGQTVTTFTTDSEGRFRVPLQPGTYILHPASTGMMPAAVDQTIQVVSGKYLTVTILYDSGMR